MRTGRISARTLALKTVLWLVLAAGVVAVASWIARYSSEPADEALQTLIRRLKDDDLHVRASAAHALGKIGRRESASALIEAMEADPLLFDVGTEALRQMGIEFDYSRLAEGTGSAADGMAGRLRRAVRDVFRGADPLVTLAARLLATIIVIAPIWWGLNWLDRRFGVIELFVPTRGGKAKGRLRVVRYGLGGVLLAAVFLFVQLTYARVMTEELQPGAAAAFQMKLTKIELAGRLKIRSAVPMLVATLADAGTDARLRWRAAYSLGRIGETSVTPVLAVALNDPNNQVRQYSAWAIGNLRASEALREDEARPLVVKFCAVCGAAVSPTMRFCANCGNRLPRIFEPAEERGAIPAPR